MTEKEAQKFISERDRLGKELKLLQLEEHIKCLKRELNEARAEVAAQKDIIAAYESVTANQQTTVRPEPSRLEIAAMLIAGRFSNTVYVTEVKGDWIKYALDGADALIAAAKEVTK